MHLAKSVVANMLRVCFPIVCKLLLCLHKIVIFLQLQINFILNAIHNVLCLLVR